MSNVTLFVGGGSLAIPEYLKGVGVDEQTKKLAGGGGGLRISIKGGVFRMLNNSEEIAKNDDRAMNVVIVASSPDTARTFYADDYVEGEAAKPPTCWSTNGEAPEPDVKTKQSAKCATCPQNVAGSGANGSRACKYSRQLAVVLDGDIGGKVFKLSLPSMSIFGKVENGVMPLQAFAKQLIAHNVPVNAVVTELRFDTTVSTPKLGFKAVRYLTAEEFEISKTQGETPEAIEATRTTIFQADNSDGVTSLAGTNPAAAQPAAQPTVQTTAVAEPAVIGNTATVAATAPVTAPKRTRAKPAAAAETAAAPAAAPAATPAPAAATPAPAAAPGGMTVEQMQQQMAQMAAMMAAMQTGTVANLTPAATQAAVVEQPVVVQTAGATAALPQDTAAMLSSWDEDGDE